MLACADKRHHDFSSGSRSVVVTKQTVGFDVLYRRAVAPVHIAFVVLIRIQGKVFARDLRPVKGVDDGADVAQHKFQLLHLLVKVVERQGCTVKRPGVGHRYGFAVVYHVRNLDDATCLQLRGVGVEAVGVHYVVDGTQ